VKDHPVIGQLLELRAVMEKMRPLDAKLKYQVDRLLKVRSISSSIRCGDDGGDKSFFLPTPSYYSHPPWGIIIVTDLWWWW